MLRIELKYLLHLLFLPFHLLFYTLHLNSIFCLMNDFTFVKKIGKNGKFE